MVSARMSEILTINGGSSSIKFAIFTTADGVRMTRGGRIEGVGGASPTFTVDGGDGLPISVRALGALDRAGAVDVLLDWVDQERLDRRLQAIGHRVVHGGPNYHTPQLLTPAVMEELRRLTPLDPEHLPQEILLSEAFARRFPQLPQVACFDTAFHHDLPQVARLLPIPRRYEALGVRRYGFHGLSYEYLVGALKRIDGAAPAAGDRAILAHLGNGASLVALAGGKPIDTSMGFTPASGVPMSTRSGDLDPGLLWYLARTEGMDARAFNDLVNFKSGLLGISETSGDMRDLLACEAADHRAAEAVDLFCYQVRKWIGGFAAALGGLDTLVFSGGIGERSPVVRERICAGLGFLGIELDPPRNAANAPLVSADAARVRTRVIHTNEEQVIAESVCRVMGLTPGAAAVGA